jgi:penicillin amidase
LIYDAYVGPMGAGGTGSEGGRPGRRSVVPNQADEPAWRLLAERPAHLVPPGYPDWNAVVEAGMARTLAALDAQAGGRVGDFTWGAVNRAEVRHPLTRALPALSVLLDPPETPQPGDLYQPRVAAPGFGASQRFVVAPGQEGRGLFHMPAGQSGHPLSPYYNFGHGDWAAGQPAPFLPGPARWQMTFQPGRRP